KMASFAEALYTLPASRLRALVQTRGVPQNKLSLTPGKRQLVQFLATELSRAPSVMQAVLQGNARELRLLQLLTASETGNEVPWSRLLEAAGGKGLEEALAAIMARLEDLGLAIRMNAKVYLPDTVRTHVPVSLPDRYLLERCLGGYDAPTLKRIYNNL